MPKFSAVILKMANLKQRLAYTGLALGIWLSPELAAQDGGLAERLKERAPVRQYARQDSTDSLLQKAVAEPIYRAPYLETIVRVKPENVVSVYYDHMRNVASADAKRSAMAVSTRYYQRFDEKGIEKELAEFLKDSDLYAKIPRESAERGIRNFLRSKSGREALAELIESNVRSKIVDYIETADAVTILVGYDAKLKVPKYQVFIFPSAFEAKDGKKPTTRSMNDLLLRQFEFAKKGLVIPQ